MSKKFKIGYITTIAGGILWAVAGVCGEYLFDNKALTSDWLVPVRLLISGAFILIISLIRGHKIFAPWKNIKDIGALIIFAIFGTVLTQYGYFSSIAASNAATGTVLSYISPIFIILYTSIRYRMPPRIREAISALLIILGTVVLATHGSFSSLSLSPTALFWGILSSIGFSIYSLQPSKLIEKYGTLPIVGWGMFIGGIVLSLIFQPWHIQGVWDASAFLTFGILVIFGTVMSFTFYLMGIQIIGPSRGCILSAVEPVFSTILSAVVLGTTFDVIDLLGFALIISTVFILAFDDKKQKNASSV